MLAMIGNSRGHRLHRIIDLVQTSGDDCTAKPFEPFHVQSDIVIHDEDRAGAMIVRVLDIGDHAREGKSLKIPAAHLNDRAKTAIESATAGCLDHIDLSSEHGVSGEDASTAFWWPDFALLKAADGPITVMAEIIAVPVGQAGDHFV